MYIWEKLEFEKQAPTFMESIDDNDGRYVLVKGLMLNAKNSVSGGLTVCDIGCGKGRYLKKLAAEYPDNTYYASDISEKVMNSIDCVKEKRLGSMTNIDYDDESFDYVYVCEAYEHAIGLRAAFRELYRITKHGGRFVIIDKPVGEIGNA